ncbi:hypothetical protein ABW19_dt0209136 [Dactylella cylindrospora]|nr:hypothetical protein ABW19_dt0209136 [Dactylella cylindrospora]
MKVQDVQNLKRAARSAVIALNGYRFPYDHPEGSNLRSRNPETTARVKSWHRFFTRMLSLMYAHSGQYEAAISIFQLPTWEDNCLGIRMLDHFIEASLLIRVKPERWSEKVKALCVAYFRVVDGGLVYQQSRTGAQQIVGWLPNLEVDPAGPSQTSLDGYLRQIWIFCGTLSSATKAQGKDIDAEFWASLIPNDDGSLSWCLDAWKSIYITALQHFPLERIYLDATGDLEESEIE